MTSTWRRASIVAIVLAAAMLSCSLPAAGQPAWIDSSTLPDEVVLGKPYRNVRVNLTTMGEKRSVSTGTLYLGDPSQADAVELDRVEKEDGDLSDEYELFRFSFRVTTGMAEPGSSQSFYLRFTLTDPYEVKRFRVAATAVEDMYADFSWMAGWTQWQPTTGSPVQFKDRSHAAGEDIVSWRWSFGDGSSGMGRAPSHTYSEAGTYNVTLYVESAAGGNDTTTRQLVVHEPTTATPPVVIAIVGIAVIGVAAAVVLRRRRGDSG